MRISEREAAALLAERGYSRERARLVLIAGLAGQGRRIGRSTTYDTDAVRALGRRHTARALDLGGIASGGFLVLRVSSRRPEVRAALAADALALMKGPWRMSWVSAWPLKDVLDRCGAIPAVISVSGVVVTGGEIKSIISADPLPHWPRPIPRYAFDDITPVSGDWFLPFASSLIPGKPGSEWLWWPEPSVLRRVKAAR